MEEPDKHKTPEDGSLPGFVSRKAGTPSERDRKALSAGEDRLDHAGELHDVRDCRQALKTQQQKGQALLSATDNPGTQALKVESLPTALDGKVKTLYSPHPRCRQLQRKSINRNQTPKSSSCNAKATSQTARCP
jgi:hypothetical protein